MKQEVLERFCSKYAITANDAAHLLERMTLVSYPRGSFLVREGECNSSFLYHCQRHLARVVCE